MNIKKTFQDSERAVSPVIGVILMVAITVILAAVIGTFVLGLGDQLGQNANAGVSIDEPNSSYVTVTLVSQGNVDLVTVNATDDTGSPPSGTLKKVGDTVTVEHSNSSVQIIGDIGGEETVLRTYEP
ncbi:type IV pilin N-terminal domain-containing protein [Halorubrum ezzemoulense]|uniref:type IV pilin N-terminal domain-containing protein n=1 Tax=Halorubrum ezzemoulense TaxID=337243 RepID=UPI00232FA0EC|nr:type IV pilin N-terminal domain-containing protein [Halorubrum ezzemoulense]MDB9299354.1 type IV pilin N-terminal domain-containing protein [Halorubrum ezzemoulense]